MFSVNLSAIFFFGFADAVADVSLLWLLVADVDIIRYGFGSLVMPRDVTATKSGRWGKPPQKFITPSILQDCCGSTFQELLKKSVAKELRETEDVDGLKEIYSVTEAQLGSNRITSPVIVFSTFNDHR